MKPSPLPEKEFTKQFQKVILTEIQLEEIKDRFYKYGWNSALKQATEELTMLGVKYKNKEFYKGVIASMKIVGSLKK